jgi:hypothetical protein
MAKSVRRAIANPPEQPVVPDSNFAGYSGTPLPKKLGIKAGATVALVAAPDTIEDILGRLPDDTTIVRKPKAQADVTLWFLNSLSDLERGMTKMADITGAGRLWICWPKKASGITSDVSQNEVRSRGLAAGLVDFKICAIDETWSGLCFARRKK